MIETYQKKIIVSGEFVETYEYEKKQIRGYKNNDLSSEKLKKMSEAQIEKKRREDNLNRSRNGIKRLIYANDDMNKFLTLTHAENLCDVQESNLIFKKFIRKVKRKNEDLKYLSIVEFQKRGAVHYHTLSNMAFMKAGEIAELWGSGFIKINKAQSEMYDSLAPYVAKYLTKSKIDSRLCSKKAYFHSRNLSYPQVITDFRVADSLSAMYNLSSRKPRFEKTFFNEYAGNVKYKCFRISTD